MKKIVICGTHLTPALALIEKLQKENQPAGGIQIIFFGREFATEGSRNQSAEYRLVSAKNIPFVKIKTGRLQRKFTRFTIPSLLKIPIGLLQSLFYLVKFRPHLIVSFGGYLSTPVVITGSLIGIDSITHEQAAIPGLANKINSIFVKKIFLSWPESAKYFPKDKCQIIGNLTRSTIFQKHAVDKKVQEYIEKRGRLIFITGGNQGSHFINELFFDLLPKLKNYSVIHQVGNTNFKGDLDRAKSLKSTNYLARDYFDSEDFGAVMNRADLVISRSGANTVWDIATLAKVSILVPLSISAGGEQKANAQILANAQSARILDQKNLTGDVLFNEIKEVFKDHQKYRKNALQFSKTLPSDSVKVITKYITTK